MTAIDKLKEVSAFLKSQGIEDAAKEAEILITETLKRELRVKSYELGVREKIYAESLELSDELSELIDSLTARRAKREPLQYIIGHVEFYGLKIKVGEGVLIPRPETELLAEEVIKRVKSYELGVTSKKRTEKSELKTQDSKLKILDFCTGSGCLALAIAKHFPDAEVYGSDISKDAIRYAKENAGLNGIRNAVFLKGSLFEPLKQIMFSGVQSFKFDVIVSNPPYIRSGDMPNLQPEINKWEPRNALDGGEDGLSYYRTILSEARGYLMISGVIFLEIGEGQAEGVSGIAMQNGFWNVSVIRDYAGIERIVAARAL